MTHCLKCKQITPDSNIRIEKSVNNRNIQKSTCSVCSAIKSKFIKIQNGGDDIDVKLNDEVYKKPDKRNDTIEGFVLDKELSNKRTSVYNNPVNNETRVVHRGTDLLSAKDLKDDVLLSVGLLNKHTSQRVKNAHDITVKAKEKYNINKIHHTAHSLGGEVTKSVMSKNDTGDVYNPGVSPISILSEKKHKNLNQYTTGIDPISISSLIGKNKVTLVKPKKLNVHSLDNFK